MQRGCKYRNRPYYLWSGYCLRIYSSAKGMDNAFGSSSGHLWNSTVKMLKKKPAY